MDSFEEKLFTFPFDADQTFPTSEDNVCVVSIVGKSVYNPYYNKAATLNPFIGKQVFNENTKTYQERGAKYAIEGYYSRDEKVLFLHLRTALDTNDLIVQSEQLLNTLTKKDDHEAASSCCTTEYIYSRALLFLFSVSHILVLYDPSKTFDIGYVRLFKVLDSVRFKLQDEVCDILHELNAPKGWTSSGRPCSPRVLFCFHSALNVEWMKNKSKSHSPLKKLQHSIEDQIYAILRKARVITNISNHSLFAVPANEAFVYIQPHSDDKTEQPITSPISYYLAKLKQHSNSEQLKNASGPDTAPGFGSLSGDFFNKNTLPVPEKPHTFQTFLEPHIELAHTRGFNDNIGRNPPRALFEMTTIDKTLEICDHMYEFFMYDVYNTKRYEMEQLKLHVEIDETFSENRCAKLKSRAEAVYREGLSTYYRTHFHLKQLSKAKATYLDQARGAATQKYLHLLEQDCTQYWASGHQLCEAISLTMNPCANVVHRLSDDEVTEDNKHLAAIKHSSKIVTKSTCNCGRVQEERSDPFDIKAANYTFYVDLSETCCRSLYHYELPVFKPSTSDTKAGILSETKKIDKVHATLDRKDSKLENLMSNMSLCMSLGQSGGSDVYNAVSSEATESAVVIDDPAIIAINTPEKVMVKQHSTTEYLPGMTHSDCPKNLLPQFSSWSLIKLCKYEEYNPVEGLDQPGFTNRCNFLLPWEMTIKTPKDKWPSVGDTSDKKSKPRKHPKDSGTSTTICLYFGYEYECPRGHRFMCSAPERVYKNPASQSGPKENASKVLSSDMPLYAVCPCRKNLMGQLMRVYAAIPEGFVEVTLEPYIQPAPLPCPKFHMGIEQGIILQNNALSVLRLPYIYMGESGVYPIPTDSQQLLACNILKNAFTIKEL